MFLDAYIRVMHEFVCDRRSCCLIGVLVETACGDVRDYLLPYVGGMLEGMLEAFEIF